MSVAYAVVIMNHRSQAHSPIRADNNYIPLCTRIRIRCHQSVRFLNTSFLTQDNLFQNLICNFPRQLYTLHYN